MGHQPRARAMADDGTSVADPGPMQHPIDGEAASPSSPLQAGTVDYSAPTPHGERDIFIDFVRAFSLLVVVAWHWVFTIIIWKDNGPSATNPIGFTRGLFIVTWLFQVMPLFFFVGGFAHAESWEAASEKGRFRSTLGFAWSRAGQLARPALALAVAWWLLGSVAVALFEINGVPRAVKLVLSPLWFIIVYLLLVLLFPITHWLHEKFGVLVLVWGVGIAVVVDVARFSHNVSWIAWVNMIVVWATCHQLGYFWEELVSLGRRAAWGLAWIGLFSLTALVGSKIYPGSMVGVPGDKISNMAPPTITILALLSFQAGVALLIRPWVLHRLRTSERWANASEIINRFSLPLFLFHSTGMAVWAAFGHYVLKNEQLREPNLQWWLTRPLAFIGPLLLTMPIILLLGRKYVKKRPAPPVPAST
ncbi:MAG: acyltransferase [Aquihabitans sp.]